MAVPSVFFQNEFPCRYTQAEYLLFLKVQNITKNGGGCMTKKVWFYLCIIQAIILAGVITISLWPTSAPKFEKANLEEYLVKHSNRNYLPDAGYIPDAKTAKIIGSQILDNLNGNSGYIFSGVYIEYDEENRLWLVSKGYSLFRGGEIVLEQDSGKVIKAFLTISCF